MKSLTKEKGYDLIDAFNSTSRYLDDLLNIDTIHFEHIVHRIYPAELQLNKANASDTEAAFLDLDLSIHNDIVSTKIQGVNKVRRHCSISYNFRINVHSILKLYRFINLFDTKVITILQFLPLYFI